MDIGEGFPFDEALLEFATSANVCCGVHAGSPELTQQTVALCQRRGVRIGMHPGYPDRENMGRKPMPHSKRQEYLESLLDQLWLTWRKTRPAYVKPHGAFYNETAAILEPDWKKVHTKMSRGSSHLPELNVLSDLPGGNVLIDMIEFTGCLLGLPGTAHVEFARCAGGRFLAEGFADRAYRSDGTLVPRSEPGAVLHEPKQIKQQVLRLAEKVDSICLHGDTPNCLEFAELVTKTLIDAGYEVGH